jgi:uncharacterized protein
MHRRLFATLLLGLLFLLSSLSGCGPRSIQEPQAKPSPPPIDRSDVTIEDVHFRCGDNLLAGSLFRPQAPGPRPAVALVLGSGKQDRSYGGMGTALAKHFARQGFACLTWDKPGVGNSTGDFNAQNFRDRAEEALAAVRFLRDRPDIRRDQVGVWGHSQGGMVAPLAASLSDDVGFLIEVSGWQGPAWKQDSVRVEAELRADDFSEADVAAATAFARRRMDLIRSNLPFEELDKEQEAVKEQSWFPYVHRCDRILFESARPVVGYDSGPSWEGVRCPVLVIYGDKDTSSGPPDDLVALIRRGLAKAGNHDVTVKIFPNADHSLRPSKTGRKEAAQPAKARESGEDADFAPGYVDAMTLWLTERFGASP